MNKLKKILFILPTLSLLTIFTPANAEIKVVTSIKPIHSLASYLMDGVGKPDLIVDGFNSPHGFSMKPSHAKMLQNADLIFWIGEDLESFLEKPLNSIAKKAEKIELIEIKGLNVLKFRERNIFDEHDHDDHAKKEDDHEDHANKEDSHDDHAKKEDGHDDHDEHEGHGHGEYDPHIWLDPINAKVILKEMTEHLIENDSKNASTYKSNLDKALNDIDKLTMDVMTELNESTSSIVFHDAYQYFEKRFNVKILGAFTVNTDIMPGAAQLSEIREIIVHDKVKCIFSEPQFNPDIIKVVAKDMNIKTGVVDPLGATLNPGKNLYFDLIRNMSASFKGC
ncbi:MAG: zinc ABC transporter substrate-binding protein [Candidatus Pelagibacter bacterium]|jgi:zinc transport system substrate-binding protein|nr:zinc ABC transporter substrate-binding protein [Pelagibacterales bacterium]MBL6862688.1 zinc ABC transporter substrate-binding protein [Candidatus Pelagibacter bacterium]